MSQPSLAPQHAAALRQAPRPLHTAGVVHGFTTRVGPGGGPLDLRPHSPSADWAALAAALGLPGAAVARCSQVHGDRLLEATEGGVLGEADALFTTVRGLVLCVRVADCTPVLLIGPGVVAAVHAGWRGAAAGIVPRSLEALRARGLSVEEAIIGPSICARCYEVGEEVVEALCGTGVEEAAFVDRSLGPRPHVDVAAAVAEQLRQAGLQRQQRLADCSRCDPALHSHRRDGAASGRMGALVALR